MAELDESRIRDIMAEEFRSMLRERLTEILKISASFGVGSVLTYAALRIRSSSEDKQRPVEPSGGEAAIRLADEDKLRIISAQVEELEYLRDRLKDSYALGRITKEEYERMVAEIDERIKKLERLGDRILAGR